MIGSGLWDQRSTADIGPARTQHLNICKSISIWINKTLIYRYRITPMEWQSKLLRFDWFSCDYIWSSRVPVVHLITENDVLKNDG